MSCLTCDQCGADIPPDSFALGDPEQSHDEPEDAEPGDPLYYEGTHTCWACGYENEIVVRDDMASVRSSD